MKLKLEDTLKKLENLKAAVFMFDRSEEYGNGYLDGIGAAYDYLKAENDKA